MFANLNPLGFFAAAKAQDTDDVIGQTEQLVASLGTMDADLTSAQEALRAAKALQASRAYSKAVAQARRAAALAVTLTDRFNAYMAAWKTLQGTREELERIGYPTEVLETALDAADREVARTVPEDGTEVPNYLGATALLERAMEEARTIVADAREASREIFLATLAAASLSEAASAATPTWLAIRLEEMIEQATHELALGHSAKARRIASEARSRADGALAGHARTWELIDTAAAVLAGLLAKGRVADELADKVEAARGALAHGYVDPTTASVLAGHLTDEVAAFARPYPQARKALERAERIYARLRQDGYSSEIVDAALAEARRALGEGEWAAVREQVFRATDSFVRLRATQDRLTRAVAEIAERAALLKVCQLPLLADVEEILARAREEIRTARISDADEDVALAGVLMMQATRTGTP